MNIIQSSAFVILITSIQGLVVTNGNIIIVLIVCLSGAVAIVSGDTKKG